MPILALPPVMNPVDGRVVRTTEQVSRWGVGAEGCRLLGMSGSEDHISMSGIVRDLTRRGGSVHTSVAASNDSI